MKDFAPLIRVASTPGVLLVHLSVPAKTVQELAALAKAKPGQLSFGSAGIGGWFQIATELFAYMTNIKMLHVPYKGAAAALTEVMGGHVQLMVNTTLAAAPHMQSGKVRALAVTSARRVPTLPQLPTMDESGVRGYEGDTWTAIGAPARTPRAAINRLNRDINAVLQVPEGATALCRRWLHHHRRHTGAVSRLPEDGSGEIRQADQGGWDQGRRLTSGGPETPIF